MSDKPKFKVGDKVYFAGPKRGGNVRDYLIGNHTISYVSSYTYTDGRGRAYFTGNPLGHCVWEDELEPAYAISEECIWE